MKIQVSENRRVVVVGDIISTIIYAVLGILLMMLGNFLVDLAIPCHFPSEIKKGNVAVGYLSAGASIAVGIILKAAISSPDANQIERSLFDGISSTVLYFGLGIVLCILGYYVANLFNQKYNLNTEIGNGNPAAGLMVMGMFIGIALVISGVIY